MKKITNISVTLVIKRSFNNAQAYYLTAAGRTSINYIRHTL